MIPPCNAILIDVYSEMEKHKGEPKQASLKLGTATAHGRWLSRCFELRCRRFGGTKEDGPSYRHHGGYMTSKEHPALELLLMI